MFISFRRSARQLYPSGMNQKKRNHCRLFKQKAVECRALRCLMALSEDLQESGEVATYIQQFRVLGGCCSYRSWKIQGHSPPPPQCNQDPPEGRHCLYDSSSFVRSLYRLPFLPFQEYSFFTMSC